jgi:hypothetical protein
VLGAVVFTDPPPKADEVVLILLLRAIETEWALGSPVLSYKRALNPTPRFLLRR